MTPFTVTNETSETVRVTPVGAVGPEGRRSTLPLVFDLEIYVPHVRSRDFTIEPGRLRGSCEEVNAFALLDGKLQNAAGAFQVMAALEAFAK